MLQCVCDWREVNLGGELTKPKLIENNKWLNYETGPEDYIAILNAKITDFGSPDQEASVEYEYCQSFHNTKRQIARAKSVKTQFMTENMEFFDLWVTDEFLSRVWQHEIDHMNGIHLLS